MEHDTLLYDGDAEAWRLSEACAQESQSPAWRQRRVTPSLSRLTSCATVEWQQDGEAGPPTALSVGVSMPGLDPAPTTWEGGPDREETQISWTCQEVPHLLDGGAGGCEALLLVCQGPRPPIVDFPPAAEGGADREETLPFACPQDAAMLLRTDYTAAAAACIASEGDPDREETLPLLSPGSPQRPDEILPPPACRRTTDGEEETQPFAYQGPAVEVLVNGRQDPNMEILANSQGLLVGVPQRLEGGMEKDESQMPWACQAYSRQDTKLGVPRLLVGETDEGASQAGTHLSQGHASGAPRLEVRRGSVQAAPDEDCRVGSRQWGGNMDRDETQPWTCQKRPTLRLPGVLVGGPDRDETQVEADGSAPDVDSSVALEDRLEERGPSSQTCLSPVRRVPQLSAVRSDQEETQIIPPQDGLGLVLLGFPGVLEGGPDRDETQAPPSSWQARAALSRPGPIDGTLEVLQDTEGPMDGTLEVLPDMAGKRGRVVQCGSCSPMLPCGSEQGVLEARSASSPLQRKRLRSKQPPPAAWSTCLLSTLAVSASRPSSQLTARQSEGAFRTRWQGAATEAHFPPELGSLVSVSGDGWGGGSGAFLAMVTEADNLTFTVIRQDTPRRWEETHVLREHCAPATEPHVTPPRCRRRTA